MDLLKIFQVLTFSHFFRFFLKIKYYRYSGRALLPYLIFISISIATQNNHYLKVDE